MKSIFCYVISICLLFVGCGNGATSVEPSVLEYQSSEVQSVIPTPSIPPAPNLQGNSVIIFTTSPDGMTDDTDYEILAYTNEDITPEVTLDLFIENVFKTFDKGKKFYNNISIKDNVATIDLTEDGLVYVSAGSYMEITSLKGMSKTMLCNNSNLEGISFLVAGLGYSSGHFEFEPEHIFFTREDFVFAI